ncbi:MAG: hypothetical protein S0880_20230 [Actinomycetota bacterium]|nr:hypothetical protein [Actinomycetota bacterium]
MRALLRRGRHAAIIVVLAVLASLIALVGPSGVSAADGLCISEDGSLDEIGTFAVAGEKIWVAAFNGSVLRSYDADGRQLVDEVRIEAMGMDNRLDHVSVVGGWVVAADRSTRTVAYLDPVTAEVGFSVRLDPLNPDRGSGRHAVDPVAIDGILYQPGVGELLAIDPGRFGAGDPIIGRVDLPVAVTGEVFVHDERIHIVNRTELYVVEPDPLELVTEIDLGPGGSRSDFGAAVVDGLLWTDPFASGTTVLAIDPETGAFGARLPVGRGYLTASSGVVLYLEREPAVIMVIDPDLRMVVDRIELDGRLAKPAVADGYVWIPLNRPGAGEIVVFDPVAAEVVATVPLGDATVSIDGTGDGMVFVQSYLGTSILVDTGCRSVVHVQGELDETEPTDVFAIGQPGDELLVGDWDGDGRDGLATRRNDLVTLYDVAGEPATGEVEIGFRDRLLVGDWDGDGRDTFAFRFGNELRYTDELGGPVVATERFGRAEDEILVGDWDGDGADSLAHHRGGIVAITNGLGGNPMVELPAGQPGDELLVGDWDGDGRDTFAIRDGAEYRFADRLVGPYRRLATFGLDDDEAVAGDWDGDGLTTLAVRR